MSDHDGENDNEGNAIVLFDDGDGLEELQLGRDEAVGPSGDKQRRGNWVHALTGDVCNLRDMLTA